MEITIARKIRLQIDGGEPPLPITSIATDRFDLLPLTVGHAAEMAAVLADPALHAFIGGEPLDEDALRARYARLAAGSPDPAVSWLNWVIRVRNEGRLAGTVQATVQHTGPMAEVAWVVGTPWQGRGVATEAARGLVAWLRAAGVRTVVAHIHPGHAASAAVAAAAGLSPTDVWQDGEIRWTTPPEPAERPDRPTQAQPSDS
ncbi:GNAT family N-acetyltransferase [Nonomuraea sp. SMC257]|uniref:GNAT family N-acetyltransferase n=1 Tax=Nonomuraea montanisoli TaxID=2741721 RepID=A0A7Y6I7R5_9ACTN|nr:GNAT family N-acetyltransferase [Nonomuraea montanisoli]NUW32320.1 GNAT family N-acetyltransferase [Nonomuraea montanisoli]